MSTYYSFHRFTWERNHFSDHKPFGWRCGKCCIGQLRANVTDKNQRDRKTKRFACTLRCTESSCDHQYFAVGTWGKYNKQGGVISMEYSHNDCERWFFPSAFEPTLFFFSCEPSTPMDIQSSLDEVFKLYWISSAACANAIRKLIERLMDLQAIPGAVLDQRLKLFGTSHPMLSQHLLAVKWIGNEGSHQNELERSDVLDGLELLAVVLSELYPDTRNAERLNEITNEINTKKKPRSKK